MLSDWLGRRKLLVALGYGLAAFTKPVFPLATTLGWVVAARFVDRVGKGIRGAPRDALIADLSPAALRGASFGLRQSLDTVGAFLGPLAAIALLALGADIPFVFWIAVVPAFISFALIVVAVEEPTRHVEEPTTQRLRLADASVSRRPIGRSSRSRACCTLARFSEAFLVLRAQHVGLPVTLVPIVMVVMSAVYAASAYPAGVLSDRFGRTSVLSLGIALLIAADLVLALADGTARARRGGAVGTAHGAHARPARHAGGRYRAGEPARQRVRPIPSRRRPRDVAGKRDRRRPVGRLRAERDLSGGRGVYRDCIGGAAAWRSQGQTTTVRRLAARVTPV